MTRAHLLFKDLTTFAKRFLKEEKGSSLPLFGFLLIPLVGFIGLAVDTSRGYVVKARLSNALDAAALAASHSVNTSNFQADVQQYFYANFPQGYLGSTVVLNTPNVTGGGSTIQLSASASVPTTLMRVLNFDTLDIAGSTTVSTGLASMDVVISMDMSGSMGGSKIANARSAAETLINNLVTATGNNNADGNLRFGLVPWSANVNVGSGGAYDSSATTTTTVSNFTTIDTPSGGSKDLVTQNQLFYANNSPVPLLMAPPSNWGGCVFSRYLDNGNDNDDADQLRGPVTTDDVDWFGWEPKTSNSQCLSEAISPLTSQQNDIIDSVRNLTSPGGNTNIPNGLSWAWHVLMPGEPYSEADTVATGSHQRAIVLLTDGANTSTGNDSYRGDLGWGDMDDRLKAIANNVKTEGATLYVIQYEENDPDLRTLLQQVASEPAAPYYNYAPDAAALDAVFEGIALDLASELRITQ